MSTAESIKKEEILIGDYVIYDEGTVPGKPDDGDRIAKKGSEKLPFDQAFATETEAKEFFVSIGANPEQGFKALSYAPSSLAFYNKSLINLTLSGSLPEKYPLSKLPDLLSQMKKYTESAGISKGTSLKVEPLREDFYKVVKETPEKILLPLALSKMSQEKYRLVVGNQKVDPNYFSHLSRSLEAARDDVLKALSELGFKGDIEYRIIKPALDLDTVLQKLVYCEFRDALIAVLKRVESDYKSEDYQSAGRYILLARHIFAQSETLKISLDGGVLGTLKADYESAKNVLLNRRIEDKVRSQLKAESITEPFPYDYVSIKSFVKE